MSIIIVPWIFFRVPSFRVPLGGIPISPQLHPAAPPRPVFAPPPLHSSPLPVPWPLAPLHFNSTRVHINDWALAYSTCLAPVPSPLPLPLSAVLSPPPVVACPLLSPLNLFGAGDSPRVQRSLPPYSPTTRHLVILLLPWCPHCPPVAALPAEALHLAPHSAPPASMPTCLVQHRRQVPRPAHLPTLPSLHLLTQHRAHWWLRLCYFGC